VCSAAISVHAADIDSIALASVFYVSKRDFLLDTEAVFMHSYKQQSFNETFVNTARFDLALLMKGTANIYGT
jgi:hypothetical protein